MIKREMIHWKKMTYYSIFLLLITGGGIFAYAFHYLSGPRYQGPKSGHFDGETFHNLEPTDMKGFRDFLKWQLNRDKGEWPDQLQKTKGSIPVEGVIEGKARVTFINHATILVQSGGMNILTDPIWSERASPLNWAGPERRREPGVKFENLPPIDVVLISHNHYDHLDLPTLQRLQQEHHPLFIVPLGVDLLFKVNQLDNVVALDWFESQDLDRGTIHAVPARHFSGRGLGDTNQTLWAGYVIQLSGITVFFAGDTGYGKFLELIKDKFEPMDLAILPIGAYKPEWFMQPIHMSPEEAVLAHQDLRAKQSIGIHFGTFPMADDGADEPVQDLKKALDKHGISSAEFKVLKEGEWLEVEGNELDF